MNYPKVAVVIIHWNRRDLLEKFLPSLVATNYPNLEIVVADNASTDDSIDFLIQNYPSIKIVKNDKNYGYAAGYNEALKYVEADYYVLLNNDIETTPKWIGSVIDAMQQDEKIVAAQPKLLQYNNKKMFEYAGGSGGFIDSLGYVFCRGRLFEMCEEDKNQYNEQSEIFWASGACFFIKAKAFHEANGFDGNFFAHMEEVDLCWRLQLMSYKIISVPSAIVYHVGGSTLNKSSPQKTYLNFRNSLIMLFKNQAGAKIWWFLLFRSSLDLLSSLFFLANGFPKHSLAIHKAHAHFFFNIVKWWKLRRQIQSKIKNHDVKGVYKGSVVWKHFVLKKNYFNDL